MNWAAKEVGCEKIAARSVQIARNLLLAAADVGSPQGVRTPESIAARCTTRTPQSVAAIDAAGPPHGIVSAPERVSRHGGNRRPHQELLRAPHSGVGPHRRRIPHRARTVVQINVAICAVVGGSWGHRGAWRPVIVAHGGFNVDVAGADSEHVILVGIRDSGSWIGGAAVSRERLPCRLHQSCLHLIWREAGAL